MPDPVADTAAAFFDAARAYKRALTGNAGIGLTQAEVDAFNAVIARWSARESAPPPSPVSDGHSAAVAPSEPENGRSGDVLAWGAKVSPVFRDRVRWIGAELDLEPSDLMACIAWESGRTFSPSIVNRAGSGATGLIQFMPKVAKALGTSAAALAAMTAEDQLNFVYKYFAPFKGRLKSLSDVYMAILWPAAVGKPDDYALFTGGAAYRQNAGLDVNRDGKVTKGECAARLYAIRAEGLRPENIG